MTNSQPEKTNFNSQPREDSKLLKKTHNDSFLSPDNLTHKQSITFMVCNVISQLGYLSGCAPSQLLHTCSLAAYEKLEKVLDFIATTEKTSVINIVLLLYRNTSATVRKINFTPAKTFHT